MAVQNRPIGEQPGVCMFDGLNIPTCPRDRETTSSEGALFMSTSLTLQGKHAVVFRAGGSIGAAVAKELAMEGAEVFLAGRTSASVEAVAEAITGAGGQAHAAVIDALDGPAVDDYVDAVVQQAGSLDTVFNATGPRISEYGNGKQAVDLSIEEFMTAVDTVLKSQFITARAAARQMLKQGSGVIIFLTGSPARPHGPGHRVSAPHSPLSRTLCGRSPSRSDRAG